MKRLFLIQIIILSLFASCHKDVDKTNIESIVNHSIKSIKNGNFKNLLKLSKLDTARNLSFLTGEKLMTNLHDSTINIDNNHKINFLEYEILTDKKSFRNIYGELIIIDSIDIEKINYYFKIDTVYYELKTTYKNLDGEFFYNSIYISNLTDDCKQHNYITSLIEEAKPLTNIDFQKIIWTSSRDRKTIEDFKLRGLNNYSHKLDQLKFKLTLYNNIEGVFFAKTISRDLIIEPGDTFEITINELKDYYCGFELTSGSFMYNVEVISIEPIEPRKNPNESLNFSSCFKIEQLKNLGKDK